MKKASAKRGERARAFLEKLRVELRAADLKATPQRLAIAEYLADRRAPVSIDEIAHALAGRVNLVTVYRTVEVLVDAGVLQSTVSATRTRLVEYQHEHHHHVSCTACGHREELRAPQLERVLTRASRSLKNFPRVNRHTLELFGLCGRCAPHVSRVGVR